MTTTIKLWLGFGTLTTLLVLFNTLMLIRLPSIERNVHRMTDVARPRSDASRELTLSVLDYAVIVSTHLANGPEGMPEIKVAAAEVERHLAAYQLLAETPRQRELAARFAAQWQELYAFSETLGDTIQVTQEDVGRFDSLRIRLEQFLNDDVQRDAIESYSFHKETVLQELRALFGFLVILTAVSVAASFLTSIVVGQSIVRAEVAVRESEERQRMAQSAGNVGTFDWDLNSNTAQCSDEYFLVMGAAPRKSRRVTFEEWQSWLHPDDRERVLAELRELTGQQNESAADYRIVCADGRTRWINYRGRITRTQTGVAIRILGTVHDITDRKRAEENLSRLANELHAKVEELTTLIDILPGAVLMADPECRQITGNRAFYEMIGLPQGTNASLTAEHPELPVGTCVYRDGRKLPPDEFPMQATGRTGQRIMGFDHDLVFPDGRVLTLLANTAPLLDEQGAVRGVLGFYMDISDRKRAEDEMREQKVRLRAILDTAADAIITIDVKGIIQTVNKATERMFGYSTAELIGQNVKMLMPSPYRDEHDRYLDNFDKTGVTKIIGSGREVVAQRKDNSRFPADLAVSRVDHLKLFTGILRDISQRKNAEEALRESERFARSTLDGLTAHIAILDETGTILAVNRSWRDFATANSPATNSVSVNVEEGANYLSICQKSVGPSSDEGPAAAAGIRAVLAKTLPEFTIEYPCHGPDEERWFLMRVTPFPGDGPRRVVVAHEEVTRQKMLEREVVEIASLEQRRIGQDLHDSVGQELTALSMLAGSLSCSLQSNPSSAAKVVERMVEGLQRTHKELRAVMLGLLPVAVDAEGLMAALADLTDRIQKDGQVNCTFDCPEVVPVADNLTATHLYLIAQEAVHNAFKHARPANIWISLKSNDSLEVSVHDDGIGMLDEPTENLGGLGLRIMRNRAAIIGANLVVGPAEPAGTIVTCTLKLRKTEK